MTKRPFLTVLVPGYNAMSTLRQALAAIVASDLPRSEYELVLIDDGSTDETSLVGAEYADMVVRLSGKPHGPAFARNRGAEASRGDVVVFVDADVVVHPNALRLLAERFRADAGISAVFGSYDDEPEAKGLVTQYRNLLHHYVHHRGAGEAETFWAGLGAIRREAFIGVGMFDEWHYARPQIEDIELGRRLRRAGHRLVLDPAIQGKHLKRWTLRTTLVGDFRHRGVPWMWLLLQEGQPAKGGSLNIQSVEKALTLMMGIGLLLPLIALFLRDWRPLLGTAAIFGIVLLAKAGFHWFLLRRRGLFFMLGAMPLHLAYYAGNVFSVFSGWLFHQLFGEPIPPAEVSAHAQIGIDTWPPPPRRVQDGIWERPGPSREGR